MSSEEPEAGPVEPVADDGVAAVAVGTAAWALGLVGTALAHDRLAANGHSWVIWVCAAGLVVGAIVGVIVWRRHVVYQAHRAALAPGDGPTG